MGEPKVGDRRPREGRCERCDRPLTDVAWTTWTPLLPADAAPVTDWREDDSTDTHCVGDPLCNREEIDWRARALAAEASLSEIDTLRARVAELEAAFDADSIEAVRIAHYDRCVASDRCDCLARAARMDAALRGGTPTLDAIRAQEFRDGARHGLLAAALAVTRVHHQAASLPTVPSAAVRALAEAVRSIEAFDRCVAPMFAEETPDA